MNLWRWLFGGGVLAVLTLSTINQITARVEPALLGGTFTYTPLSTVTGWPTRTPTLTRTATLPGTNTQTATRTSQPGEPILIVPPDGALMPQPVPPNDWYFVWSGRTGPCSSSLSVRGPNGQGVSAVVTQAYQYHYTTTTPIADTDLGPWFWSASIQCPLGSSYSETRTFWVESAGSPSATPTLTATLCPQPTPEPLWVEPVTSPTNLLSQPITIRIGNGDAVTVTAESGVFTTTGIFNAYANPAAVTMTLLSNTTHHVIVQAHVRPIQQGGCAYGNYTLSTILDQSGAPLTIVQLMYSQAYLPVIMTNHFGSP